MKTWCAVLCLCFTLLPAQATDHCPAQIIPGLPFHTTGNTSTFNLDVHPQCTYGSLDDLFALSLACETAVTVSTCPNSDFDTALEIRRGANGLYTECPGTIVETCNDEFCFALAQLTFTAQPGVFYFIVLGGVSEWDSGPYELHVTGVPCAGPEPVDDLVVHYNSANQSIELSWGSVPNAVLYHVYHAAGFEGLFDASNIIADVTSPGFICPDCTSQSTNFFGVTAEN